MDVGENTGGVVVDAVVEEERAGEVVVDAVVEEERAGGVVVDAVVEEERTGGVVVKLKLTCTIVILIIMTNSLHTRIQNR